MILKCDNNLKTYGYKSTCKFPPAWPALSATRLRNYSSLIITNLAVVFQVSQVGNAPEAEQFIGVLHNDPEVGHMVYCTTGKPPTNRTTYPLSSVLKNLADKIDQKLGELRENERNLERWVCRYSRS